MDASMSGWGASMLDAEVRGIWSIQDQQEHITLLELRGIRLGLQAFTDAFQGKSVVVLLDNTMTVSYIKKAGGTRSALLNQEAQKTLQWAEENSVTILTQLVRGANNVLADALSKKNHTPSTEWVLHQ